MVALSAAVLASRIDSGGGPVPTRLVPADLDAVGRRFATGQHDLDAAIGALAGTLGGVEGMAGDDDPGRDFAAAYDPAVRSAFGAFAAGATALAGVAQGLVASAANHAVADAHSTVGGAAPDGPVPLSVLPPSAPRSVPSAAGGRSGGFVLPGRLADFWPAGDPERLRAAARAWRQAAATTADLGGGLHGAITGLVGNNTGPALGLIEGFWGRIWGTADAPVLSAAVSACGALAAACDAYAQHVDDVRREVEEIAAEVVAITAAGLLLTVVTAGASDAVAAAGDAALIARAADGARHLVELAHLASVPLLHAAPALDLAAGAAPQLVVSMAGTEQVADQVVAVTDLQSETRIFTADDLDHVRRHLRTLDPSDANVVMLGRIHDAITAGGSLTAAQKNFMRHELTEEYLMGTGMSYTDAHAEALKTHPPGQNFDVDVIDSHPEFGPWWRKHNGLGPR